MHKSTYLLYRKCKNAVRQKVRFKELFNLRPNLKEEDMAKVLPITFRSRDGFILHGYLTLPKQIEQGLKVPLIMHPHGPTWRAKLCKKHLVL